MAGMSKTVRKHTLGSSRLVERGKTNVYNIVNVAGA
jgi:hypothetical protein